MTGGVWWLGLLIVASLVCLAWVWRRRLHPLSQSTVIARPIQRLLRPRTPHDCPACRQQATAPTHAPSTCPPISPWSERKSRRGAPKRIVTQGFACPNRSCMYYRITDAHIHAFKGDGAEGKAERIQTLRCHACTTTFSTRRGYPLGDTTVPPQDGIRSGCPIAECAIRRTRCIRGHARVRSPPGYYHVLAHTGRGAQCHAARPHLSRRASTHVQLDEIRTRLRSRAHGLWLWLAVEMLTKIVPVLPGGPEQLARFPERMLFLQTSSSPASRADLAR
jgi:hypothetical protein